MIKYKSKISIIVPIYNVSKYLDECISTILSQTYRNIQVILVDDGSTDNSLKICKSYEELDSRVIAITQTNSGVSAARNKGLEIADGEWVMFVDPDDKLDTSIIEELLKQCNDRVDIVACSCFGFIDDYQIKIRFFDKNKVFCADNKEPLFLQLLDGLYGQPRKSDDQGTGITAIGVPWGKLYRRSFLKKYDLLFDIKLRRMQDNLFNMYAFYYADKIVYLDQQLYFYRLNNISNYTKKNYAIVYNNYLNITPARFRCLTQLQLFDNEKIQEWFLNDTANIYLMIVQSFILSGDEIEEIRKKSENLKTIEGFDKLFIKGQYRHFHSKSTIIKLCIIKHRMYGLYSLLFKMSKRDR